MSSPGPGPGGGWRRAATELRRAGRRVNNRRVQRLWRQEGLKVPCRECKEPHRETGVAVEAMRRVSTFLALRPDQRVIR